MAKLTKEQAEQLAALEELRDAPDEPQGGGRSEVLNVTIDLGDEKAVDRALKLGWLKPGEVVADDDDDDKKTRKEKTEKTPKRRGYFEGGE